MTGVDTTIGVTAATRDRLAALKRELGAASIDVAIDTLLEERAELEQRRTSDRFLAAIAAHREELAALCQRHHIRRLSVFGSAIRGDARPGSDIDLLVEFHDGRVPSGYRFVGIEMELEELIGVAVDLNTAEDLSPLFRDDVVAQAQVAYAAA